MTTAALPAASRPIRPRSAWLGGDMPFARWGLILNLLVPIVLLAWDAKHQHLGVDAIHFALHTTGQIAVIYLALSLVVTPLRQVTGWSWLIQFRRSLGVYAFYYAAAHLTIYIVWDRGGSVRGAVYEITHRYYLAIGFASLALMAPLWATSFNAAIRKMGGANWKRLHRLAYVAAVLAGIHYYLQSKSYKLRPEIYLAVVGVLLAWRAVTAVVAVSRRQAAAASGRRGASNVMADNAGGKQRFWKGDLKVVGVFRETPSVRTFRFAPADGGPVPFAFAAGQFLNLTLDINGQRVSRSYTIASPPTRDAYVELTVKREDNGLASRHLHDTFERGRFVQVSAPAGRFVFDTAGEQAVLLIAGGVGITPVMSILRDLTDRCWNGAIDLVFSVKTPDELIFAAELELLSARHADVRLHKTFTRDVPAGWAGPRGRITADMLRRLVPDLVDRRAFVCGPDAMAAAVHDELRSAGVPEQRITLESFTAAAPATPAVTRPAGRAITVTFSPSNVTAAVQSDQTILEAAEAAGVPIDYQCRAGVCGTCRCRLLDGQVKMDVRDALSEKDEADGYILACQARADGDVTISA